MRLPFLRPFLAGLACLALLTACGPAPVASGISDPYEEENRGRHGFNRALDQAFLRPAARGYGTAVPVPVQRGINNFADNLDTPRDVVNNILQLRLVKATANSVRFLINSTVGIGGIFDPATAMGLPADETDFGETLHIWGVPEGNYTELPFFGPSTNRDAAGIVVDQVLNPLRWILPTPERFIDTFGDVASGLGTRNRHGELIDSILYESADSYAQARLLYLQNRRFELGGQAQDTYLDPYADPEDPYADPDTAAAPGAAAAAPASDPFSDPYFDPYAE